MVSRVSFVCGSQNVELQELQRQRWIRRLPKYPNRLQVWCWHLRQAPLALCGETSQNSSGSEAWVTPRFGLAPTSVDAEAGVFSRLLSSSGWRGHPHHLLSCRPSCSYHDGRFAFTAAKSFPFVRRGQRFSDHTSSRNNVLPGFTDVQRRRGAHKKIGIDSESRKTRQWQSGPCDLYVLVGLESVREVAGDSIDFSSIHRGCRLLRLVRIHHSLQHHMNRSLRIGVFGHVVTHSLQFALYLVRPHPSGVIRRQDASNFIAQSRFQKVDCVRARLHFDTFALANARQALQVLANYNQSLFCFLLLRQQHIEFGLCCFVGLAQIQFGGCRHESYYKQT